MDELLFPGERNGGGDAATARAESGEHPRHEEVAAPPLPERTLTVGAAGTPVQRADSRKKIRLASGVVWERLTAATEVGTEFLYVTYEVGGASSAEHEFQRHGGHEWGVVIDGRLHVAIGFEDHELGPGDAISHIDSSTPHRLYNDGDEPVHAIWFVLGRHSHDVPGMGASHGHRPPRRSLSRVVRALRYHGREDLRLEEVPDPAPDPASCWCG
ncbi:MAG: cupin domain-containing protein [Chloroflexota bacterium]